MENVSIVTAPRDIAALSGLTRRQLYMLAQNLQLLCDDAVETAFLSQPIDAQAATVLQGLMNYDASGGQPAPGVQPLHVAPQAPPMAPPAPPPPQEAPQYAPQQYAQQHQQPNPYAPPIAPPPMPPQPPQTMQYGAPPPQPPMMQPPPQYQPQYPPMMQPPVPPPAPPPAPPPVMQAPPMQFQPPVPPPAQLPPQAPPQAPPPQAPAAAQRQPQTNTDPSNAGSGLVAMSQLSNFLQTAQQQLALIGNAAKAIAAQQDVILKVLLTNAELNGMSSEALAKQVRAGSPEAVSEFLSALQGQPGKG
jgi:hypothetical protein